MKSVLHTGPDTARPWLTKTVESADRESLLARAGSRYAPSAPCSGLRGIEESDGSSVFIGKPCDAAAVSALRNAGNSAAQKIGLSLTFFCAGTPSTQGTLDLLASIGVDTPRPRLPEIPRQRLAGRLHCRMQEHGQPVPSLLRGVMGPADPLPSFPLQHLPRRIGDRLGDIACGDAWNKYTGGNDPGHSLVLVRTPRGQEILHPRANGRLRRADQERPRRRLPEPRQTFWAKEERSSEGCSRCVFS